jgi:hypothetical protein
MSEPTLNAEMVLEDEIVLTYARGMSMREIVDRITIYAIAIGAESTSCRI